MPDITMCINDDCSLREKCYRYMAQPFPHGQSWGNFKPETKARKEIKGDKTHCSMFMPIDGKKTREV